MKAPLVEWAWMSVVIERISATRCICFAVRGRSSLTCRPGTLLRIEPIVPRTSAGASGFGSKVSCCGGPPLRKSSTHGFARPKDEPFTRPRPGSARSNEGSPKPSAPRPPARSHSRRVGTEAGEAFMRSRSSRWENDGILPESGDALRWRICGWGEVTWIGGQACPLSVWRSGGFCGTVSRMACRPGDPAAPWNREKSV